MMRALQSLQLPSLALPSRERMAKLAPGIGLAVAVTLAALAIEPLLGRLLKGGLGLRVGLPAIVIALVIGIALNRHAVTPTFAPGIGWCAKPLLRFAVALLGLRIALGDIAGLGFGTALLIVVAMAATLAVAIALATRLGRGATSQGEGLEGGLGLGALMGAANAVCGASATLATSAVLPDYKGREADVVLTVVLANAISTLVMLAYPPLCAALGFSHRQTGIMLGGTIHDMAQVVGAGYAVSETAGDTAVVVKMFRVFLLLPVVLAIGWWVRKGQTVAAGQAPGVPGFAVAFLALCLLNSALLAMPAMAPLYGPIKALAAQLSSWGLLVAIAALGLGTSFAQLRRTSWRPLAVFGAATAVILVLVTAGVAALG